MARNTPPTMTSYTEVASWATAGATKSVTVSWSAGSVLVFVGLSENNDTIGVPTATGLTFTSRALNITASTCGSRVATAVAAAPGTGVTITASNTSSVSDWGFGVWVFDGSDGFDAAAEQHTSTKTVGLTHTDTHSATCWAVGDFAAAVTTSVLPTPTATHVRQSAQITSHYTRYVADLADQASSGSVPYGVAGGSGTGPFSIAACAVLGTTVGGTTAKKLAALGVG